MGYENTPDTEVWLTKEDIVAGVDTVAEAALEWITAENEKGGFVRESPIRSVGQEFFWGSPAGWQDGAEN